MKRDQIRKKIWEKAEKLEKIKLEEFAVDIYYRPVTLEDEQRLKLNDELMDSTEKAIQMIFHKALDEDGERIFTTQEDKEFIRTRVASTNWGKLIRAMTGISFEDAKKN